MTNLPMPYLVVQVDALRRRVLYGNPVAAVFDAACAPSRRARAWRNTGRRVRQWFGNGSVAAWRALPACDGQEERYLAGQRIENGRGGDVHAAWRRRAAGLAVHIGGQARVAASGQLHG